MSGRALARLAVLLGAASGCEAALGIHPGDSSRLDSGSIGFVSGAGGTAGTGTGLGGTDNAPLAGNTGAAGDLVTGSGGTASGGGAGSGGLPNGGPDAGSVGGTTGVSTDAGGAGGGVGSSAVTTVVSIDFVGGKPFTGSDVGVSLPAHSMGPTEIAGVQRAANWNPAPGQAGTSTGLKDSTGKTTTASLSWNAVLANGNTGQWVNNFPDTPGDVRMMNGYLDPRDSSPATIIVAGLSPEMADRGYDVYVYTFGDVLPGATRTYNYSIGGKTTTVRQTGPTPTTFMGYSEAANGGTGNYVVFRGVKGPSFTLTATPGTGAVNRAPVNGIQIVSSTR